MPDIRHSVGINAPTERVYEALATPTGLAGWWTRDVRGQSSPGQELEFHFSKSSVAMKVLELSPGRSVSWECVRGPEDWLRTKIGFELRDGEPGETIVLFTHADWREPVEFMSHCSTKWAYFLLGLKGGLEGGAAKPHPEDERISSWG
jgi:uncharacterized protein YndB with AHSA1/START domain